MDASEKSAVADAARVFIDLLSASSQSAAVAFADGSTLIQGLTTDKSVAKSAIDTYESSNTIFETHIGDGIEDAQAALDANGNPDAADVILVLSDGAPFPENTQGPDALQAADDAKAAGDRIVSLGFGVGGSNAEAYLKAIAGTTPDSAADFNDGAPYDDEGDYFEAPTTSELETVFTDIAGTITEGEEILFQGTLREALNALGSSNGIPLDGNRMSAFDEAGGAADSDDRECFDGTGVVHYLGFAWWLPIDHGNEVQSDTATFDLGFYTEQCRHNDGTGMPPETAQVEMGDQESDGATITVDSVGLPRAGYVAIHDTRLQGGQPLDSVVGVSDYLPAGFHRDVSVTLFAGVPGQSQSTFDASPFPNVDAGETGDGTLISLPHEETGGDQSYDFIASGGTEDPPFFDENGNPIVDPATVTVSDSSRPPRTGCRFPPVGSDAYDTTRTVRSRGPSHSTSKTDCHRPSERDPSSTGIVSDGPSNSARRCESAFPSRRSCSQPSSGTRSDRKVRISPSSRDSASLITTPAVVCSTKTVTVPSASSGTAAATRSVTSTASRRASVETVNSMSDRRGRDEKASRVTCHHGASYSVPRCVSGAMVDSRDYEFEGHRPDIDPDAHVSHEATLVGEVRVGADASVWPGVVLRGDVGPVEVGRESHVGDNAVLHASAVGDRVMVGHGAILNESVVGDGTLVGFNTTVNADVTVGARSIVASGTVVPEGYDIPEESFVRGVPATATPLEETTIDADSIFEDYNTGGYTGLAARHTDLFYSND